MGKPRHRGGNSTLNRAGESGIKQANEATKSHSSVQFMLTQAEERIVTLEKKLGQVELSRTHLQSQLNYVADTETQNMLHSIETMKKHFVQKFEEIETLVINLAQRSKQDKTIPSITRDIVAHHRFEPHSSELENQDASVMMRVSGFAFLIYLFLEFEHPERVLNHMMTLLTWGFSLFGTTAGIWLLMLGLSTLIVPLFLLWKRSLLSNRLYIYLYLFLQTALFYVGYWATTNLGLAPPSRGLIMCEQVRLNLKIHAFMVETYRMCTSKYPFKKMKELHTSIFEYPSQLLSQYLYFLFVPTLIYRNWYPKVSKPNIGKFFFGIFQCSMAVLVTSLMVCELDKKVTWTSSTHLIVSIAKSMIPGTVLLLLLFIGILHIWMNSFADLLGFADRRFYSKWWTATSYQQFYRRWNMVVGDWLRAYVYKDLMRIGCKRNTAFILVFVFSALVHEHICTQTLGFFHPVLFFLFLGVGCSMIFLNRSNRDNICWNVFLWVTLFVGQGIIVELYSAEFHAREAAALYDINESSWIPYSWQLFGSTSIIGRTQPIQEVSL